jgi:hypothetical protein
VFDLLFCFPLPSPSSSLPSFFLVPWSPSSSLLLASTPFFLRVVQLSSSGFVFFPLSLLRFFLLCVFLALLTHMYNRPNQFSSATFFDLLVIFLCLLSDFFPARESPYRWALPSACGRGGDHESVTFLLRNLR